MKNRFLLYGILIIFLGLFAIGVNSLIRSKLNLEGYHLNLSETQRLSLIEQCDIETLCDINVKNYIFVYGQQEPLFQTFDDRELALFRLKEVIPEYLEYLREEGTLGELSRWNWKKYNDVSVTLNFPDQAVESQMKYYFESFIDIYENNGVNYWTEVEFNRLSKKRLSPNSKQYKGRLYMLVPSGGELQNKLSGNL